MMKFALDNQMSMVIQVVPVCKEIQTVAAQREMLRVVVQMAKAIVAQMEIPMVEGVYMAKMTKE